MKGLKTITADYTLDAADDDFFLVVDSGSAVAITVPAVATKGMGPGFSCKIVRKGAGAVTFVGASGVTLNRRGFDGGMPSKAIAMLLKLSENVWLFDTGDQRIYKAYSALLTEANVTTTSGVLVIGKTYNIASVLASTATSGLLVIGRKYTIAAVLSTDDFANVGFVSVGVVFTATGTTPTTWTNSTIVTNTDDFANVGYVSAGVDFVATATTPTQWVNSTVVTNQTDAAPVATVLENTFSSAPTWTRTSVGDYNGTLTGAFTANKTELFVSNILVTTVAVLTRTSANVVRLRTYNSGSLADGLLTGTTVEIHVSD